MATSHIDFRKIDYDQLIDKPIIRTDASVDTLTSAGVYDKGDGKRYIVSVDGQNITQVIEEKDGYQERASSDGGSTWGDWDTVDFAAADDIDAEDVNYDNTTSGLQATNVQDAIDEIDTSIDEIKNIIEVTEMEEPSEENEGNIIQYKGETNANFTQGYFYKCVSDGQDPATYSWVRIDVQPSEVGDSHEFISLTAYNQLTPEQKAEKVYMITEEGVAPTPTPGGGTAIERVDMLLNNISPIRELNKNVKYGTSGTYSTNVTFYTNYGTQITTIPIGSDSIKLKSGLSSHCVVNNKLYYFKYTPSYSGSGHIQIMDLDTYVVTESSETYAYCGYFKYKDGYIYMNRYSTYVKYNISNDSFEVSTQEEYNSIIYPTGYKYKELYYSQDGNDYVATDDTGNEVKRYSGVGTIDAIYDDKLYRNVGDVAYAIATI